MKFLEILISFLATQGKSFFQANTEALSKTIVNNARRVAILLVGAVVSTTLFCYGVSMGYSALVESYDRGSGFEWSAGFIAGLVMVAISLVGLFYFLGEKRWLDATGLGEEAPPSSASQQQPQGPGIDTALALLITELAINLKESRHNAHKTQGEAP